MTRRSIEIPGLHHGRAPIPQASLVGPLLTSSGINGLDPDSGAVPETVDAQVALIFSNVSRILDKAGGTTDDIAKLTFFVRDRAARAVIDPHWVAMFPDEVSRPARHTLEYPLADPLLIQCELIAYVGDA
ncbi:RidA family protein [Rhodococcus sp. BP-316]|uniref:RidA family protein n=1 Tax=Rhodococcus sp. BP-316 TaxID=2739445 RepID=UPI001C9A90D6|nr:Rid family hydrolase [Rhodococcus sp. BP-316]MBY6683111.1 RidA family protein [Rhodococcus sp. BP-316]